MPRHKKFTPGQLNQWGKPIMEPQRNTDICMYCNFCLRDRCPKGKRKLYCKITFSNLTKNGYALVQGHDPACQHFIRVKEYRRNYDGTISIVRSRRKEGRADDWQEQEHINIKNNESHD